MGSTLVIEGLYPWGFLVETAIIFEDITAYGHKLYQSFWIVLNSVYWVVSLLGRTSMESREEVGIGSKDWGIGSWSVVKN